MLASKPMFRSGRRRFALVATLLCLWSGACLSPTLPLPPPEAPDVKQVGQGLYRVSGEVPEPAYVIAMNACTELIYGANSDAKAYAFNVRAQPGDDMQLWYVAGRFQSDSVFFEIPGPSGGVCGPDAGVSDASVSDAGPADSSVSDASGLITDANAPDAGGG